MMIVSLLCSLTLVSSMSVVESISFPRLPLIQRQERNSQMATIDEEAEAIAIEQRWKHLMESCLGNFSGSIGWYDVDVQNHNSEDTNNFDKRKKSVQFTSRSNNGQRNMRLSFLLRPQDPTVGDWVVHHAYHEGSRDAVVVERTPKPTAANDPLRQTFYSYDEGIIGRCGANMKRFPVIEHGFWDQEEGMRRTVVLVYGRDQLSMEKICFLQQARRSNSDFDPTLEEPADTRVLPKDLFLHNPSQRMALFERHNIYKQWKVSKLVMKRSEMLNNEGRNRTVAGVRNPLDDDDDDDDDDALRRLFGLGRDGNVEDSDDGILRFSLPNGVLVAAPSTLDAMHDMCFSFGYRRTNQQVQVLQISCHPSDGAVQTVSAVWYRPVN